MQGTAPADQPASSPAAGVTVLLSPAVAAAEKDAGRSLSRLITAAGGSPVALAPGSTAGARAQAAAAPRAGSSAGEPQPQQQRQQQQQQQGPAVLCVLAGTKGDAAWARRELPSSVGLLTREGFVNAVLKQSLDSK
jgi:hypothetical protein